MIVKIKSCVAATLQKNEWMKLKLISKSLKSLPVFFPYHLTNQQISWRETIFVWQVVKFIQLDYQGELRSLWIWNVFRTVLRDSSWKYERTQESDMDLRMTELVTQRTCVTQSVKAPHSTSCGLLFLVDCLLYPYLLGQRNLVPRSERMGIRYCWWEVSQYFK